MADNNVDTDTQDLEKKTIGNIIQVGSKEYREYNGTFYHIKTCSEVISILNRFIDSKDRLRLFFGNTVTGEDWEETHDLEGFVSRLGGEIPAPALIIDKRGYGGRKILDHHIVKIEYANKRSGGVLYEHAHYHRAHPYIRRKSSKWK